MPIHVQRIRIFRVSAADVRDTARAPTQRRGQTGSESLLDLLGACRCNLYPHRQSSEHVGAESVACKLLSSASHGRATSVSASPAASLSTEGEDSLRPWCCKCQWPAEGAATQGACQRRAAGADRAGSQAPEWLRESSWRRRGTPEAVPQDGQIADGLGSSFGSESLAGGIFESSVGPVGGFFASRLWPSLRDYGRTHSPAEHLLASAATRTRGFVGN